MLGEWLGSPGVAGLRRLFLLVTPNETSFEKLEDVPEYVDEAVPYFIGLMLLEWMVLLFQGKRLPRFNDTFSSLANGSLSLIHGLLFRAMELIGFMWVYERCNLITLPWDNPLTWVLCLLGMDFTYYWVHRTGHEVNVMWAGHQAHHSSQEYNLSTALRQSMVHRYIFWLFYLPLALFMPPSVFLVHLQFNLIYQFWIHTETIKSLGPLEWFLSTPSHHRVHHGRNPYCIDKNYGGVFIIWDRMFGTFQAEREEEKVVYGLVHNLQSWEPFYAQFCHLIHIIKTMGRVKGVGNKLSVLFKGPGWSPGKPRLGNPEDIPTIENPVQKFDRQLPLWLNLYIFFHYGVITLVIYPQLATNKSVYSGAFLAISVGFVMFTLFVFGSMYDHRHYSVTLELIRCVFFVTMAHWTAFVPVGSAIYWLFMVSTVIWSTHILPARNNVETENLFK